jgi:hypothetical protein
VQEEPVELRFGQRIGAFLFDGVLGRHDQEQVIERIALVAHGYLPFFHGFEQRRLDLRRCPVDLVGQDQVVEQRALAEFERALLRSVDIRPGQVRGQQVGRKLQAVKITFDALRQHLDGTRLGQAGGTLDEQVAVAEQRDQHAIDQV